MAVAESPALTRDVPPPVTPARRIGAVTATLIGALAALVLANLLSPTWYASRVLPDAMLIALLLPAAAVAPRRAPYVVAASIAGWLVLQNLYVLAKNVEVGIPVSRAVGGGAYYNTPYQPAQYVTLLVLAVAFAAAIVVRVRRGAVETIDEPAVVAPAAEAWWRRPQAIVAAGVALISLSFWPDPWARLSGGELAPIPASWDWANVLTWDWLHEHGYTPIKDFFYPYAHVIDFNATPWGPMWQWIAHTFLFACLAWAFWRLSGRSVARTLLAVLALAIFLHAWVVLDRYVGGFVLAIVYAGLGPGRHRRLTLGHLLLGVVALYTTWLEPDVLLVGVAGMVFVALGELISGQLRERPRELLRRGLVDVAPFALLLVVPLIWVIEGTLSENWRFWSGAGATGTASSRNEDLYSPLALQTIRPTYAMVTLCLPLLALIAGLVLGRVRTREARSASLLFLILAAACEVMLLKHLVRDTGVYIMVFATALVVPAVILLWTRANVRLAAMIGVFAGLAFAAVQQERILTGFVQTAVAAPGNAVDTLRLPSRYDDVRTAEEARFGGARFADWPEAQAAQALQDLWGDKPQRFAVVGDAAIMYPLLNQTPPYHVELYDAARIEEQRVYVDALKREQPRYIVFRRDFTQDNIPIPVRSPLIVQYMIENYVPVARDVVPAFDILEPRGNRPIDVKYWRSRFDTTDLGGVPGNSKADSADKCTGGEGCVPYAMLRGHTDKPEPVLLRVTGANGQAFGAVVNPNSHDDSYPVRLDRLWFAPLVGPNPRVEVQKGPGFTVTVEGRKTGDSLF